MRIWSIHPKYLDSKGLVALWRETLLAQKVLAGETKGYKHHPQLTRFREEENPLAWIGSYLVSVQKEATARGYQFDRTKILRQLPSNRARKICVTSGQMAFEREHLLRKLKVRDPSVYQRVKGVLDFEPHPLFKVVEGPVEEWERG